MIATLESNSRNYSNWIELDKIFTYSRLRRVFGEGCAKCKDDAKLFVQPPPSETKRRSTTSRPFDVSFFFHPPLPLRSYVFVPLERSLPRDLSSLRTRISLHRFISKNVKTTSLSTVSLPSLPSWFPLHFHPEYASLSSCSFSLCWLPTVGKKSKNDSSLGNHAFTFL